MDNSRQFTLEELQETLVKIEKLKPKNEIFVNRQSYDSIMKSLDFKPMNLKVNDYIPPNEAIIIDIEEMKKVF